MDNFLPIGSVVLLKDGGKRLMITGYLQKEVKTGKVWDYCACAFPEGVLNAGEAIVFNDEQITNLFFMGLQDSECLAFHEALRVSVENTKPTISSE